jgi:multiple sugar transport system ATP-binding protein
MAKVELKGISKIFDNGVRAVDSVTIEVEDKEFVVLVGPSGCGKTTTLRMIAGIDEITEGELYIDGELVNDVPPKDRNIAMVFQNYAFYPHITAFENMAFGLKMRKTEKADILRRVNETASILDIEKFLERKPKALSPGQQQRVALGRATVRDCKVYLFDEPLSALDAKLRVQMRSEFAALRRKLDATMIYVTHDQIEAMTLADRIVVMKDGKIQQVGSPLHLYNCPVNKFVAGFIGSPPMNFLSVKIIEENDEILLDEGTFKIAPQQEHAEFLRKLSGKEIHFGIRPEDLMLCENADAANAITAKIVVVEALGAETYLRLNVNNQPMVLRAEPHVQFKTGDEVNFVPRLEKAHYFHRETELSIML